MTVHLFNGTEVREGDLVEFVNSDGEKCQDVIRRDVNSPTRRLFFWNNQFDITDYENAEKIC